MDRGAWRAMVHGVAKSWTQLSDAMPAQAHAHTHTHSKVIQLNILYYYSFSYSFPLWFIIGY